MNIQEYISSGILELYVAGLLSDQERSEVEAMMAAHNEVKQEVLSIEKNIEHYNQLKGVAVPVELKDKILSQLPAGKNDASIDTKGNPLKWNTLNTFMLALTALGFSLYFINTINQNKANKVQEKQLMECDSIQKAQSQLYATLQDLKDANNKVIAVTATPKYQDTRIFLHHNNTKKVNYLQLNNLPPLQQDQVYQLWSLKPGGIAPIPMDVFSGGEAFTKVNYEEETQTYAITIEAKGGSKQPTLDRLIGTFSI